MRIVALVAVLLGSSSCFPVYRSLNGIEDPDVVAVKKASKKLRPGCDFKSAELVTRDTEQAMRWLLTGCEAPIACRDGEDDDVVCFENPPRLGDYSDHRRQRPPLGAKIVADALEKLSGCPKEDARVARTGDKLTDTFTALNCGRDFTCSPEIDSVRRDLTIVGATCAETRASEERNARRVVVDRLSVETGCPSTSIEIATSTPWARGSEQNYRLIACSQAFTCSVAGGKSDCRPAMNQQLAPPTPPPEPMGRDAG